MSELERWRSEIQNCIEALGQDATTLGVDREPPVAIKPSLGRCGFPAFFPLWSDGNTYTAGLLARPHMAVAQWPGVVVKDNQGLTIASNAATLLPQLLIARVLSNAPDSAKYLAEDWNAIHERSTALHRALGGLPESLDAVVSTVLNIDSRRGFFYRGEDSRPAFEAAHTALFRRLDNSAPYLRYVDWMDSAIRHQWQPVAAPPTYGVWARRLICSAQRFENSKMVSLGVSRDWLDWLLLGGAGVDSAVPLTPTWMLGGILGESALLSAANRRSYLTSRQHAPDRISDGLATAILDQGTRYRGLAHAEAAVALDESDRPEEAWEALQSAAWWSARNTGETPEVIRRGMLLLAQRRGWTDLEWVVRNSVPETVQ